MTTLALRPSRRAIQLFIFPEPLQRLPAAAAGSPFSNSLQKFGAAKQFKALHQTHSPSPVREVCAPSPTGGSALHPGVLPGDTAAPRNPWDEMLRLDAEKSGTARRAIGQRGQSAGRALLPAVTRSPRLQAPCHPAIRGSRLSITWGGLDHPQKGAGGCFGGTWRRPWHCFRAAPGLS